MTRRSREVPLAVRVRRVREGRWAPAFVAGWDETAELLTASCLPWPIQAVIYDLRWHVDCGLPLPGRGGLVRRWHWKDDQVREMLATPGWWWDEARGIAPTCRADLEARTPVVRRRKPTPLKAHQTPPAEPLNGPQDDTGEAAESDTKPPVSPQTPPGQPLDGSTRASSPQEQEQEDSAKVIEIPFAPRVVGLSPALRPGEGKEPRPSEDTIDRLKLAGIDTIGKLAAKTRDEVKNIRGIGPKRLETLEAWVLWHGRKFRAPAITEHALITRCADVWTAAWREHTAQPTGKYGWELEGPDRARIRGWISALDLAAEGVDLPAGLARLDHAIRAYLDAVRAGRAFPQGVKPATKFFSSDVATWLQEGDERAARVANRGRRAVNAAVPTPTRTPRMPPAKE